MTVKNAVHRTDTKLCLVVARPSAYDDSQLAQRVLAATGNKLRPGMSEQEVEAILGGPPGDYTTQLDVGADKGSG